MRAVWARRLGIVLGVVLLAFGVAETLSHLDGGWAFWALSLVGGGVLVLAGVLPDWGNPFAPVALVAAGGLLGANATLWTVVVPTLAVVEIVLVVLVAGDRIDRRP